MIAAPPKKLFVRIYICINFLRRENHYFPLLFVQYHVPWLTLQTSEKLISYTDACDYHDKTRKRYKIDCSQQVLISVRRKRAQLLTHRWVNYVFHNSFYFYFHKCRDQSKHNNRYDFFSVRERNKIRADVENVILDSIRLLYIPTFHQ